MTSWLFFVLLCGFGLCATVEPPGDGESDTQFRSLQSILDMLSPEPEGAPLHSAAIELNSRTMSRVSNGKWIVLFFSPNCLRSRQAVSTLGHLSEYLSSRGFSVAQVDAAKHVETANRFFIFSFPALKMFRDGLVIPFDRSPTKPAIVDFVSRGHQKQPSFAFPSEPSVLLKFSEEDLELITTSFLPSSPRFLVMFYAPWCLMSQAFLPFFDAWATELTRQHKDLKIAMFDGGSSYQSDRFAVQGFPTIFLFGEGNMVTFHGNRTAEALHSFVSTGFDSASVLRLPASRSWFEKLTRVMEVLSKDARGVWKFQKGVSLLIYLMGVVVGGLSWARVRSLIRTG